uniref:Ubiquitin carboxyl-terminal hydrolase n=1 Tax=Nyssomyia neivai TaxID=330878 RepID=A0A1L8DTC5_9DIPT
MECPHLGEECVKINRDFVRKLKIEISAAPSSSKTWRCLECASVKENWMCLNCGTILCGRYEKCHALRHSSSRNDHKVCMSMMNLSVFCYKCDEFVVNDTKGRRLFELRQELASKDDDSASETSTSSGASSGVDDPTLNRKYPEMTSTSSSSDSGWEEMPHSRKLRPRKRTISSDSSENTKRKSLRKVVGLRNLGNTCFMNSVLQSLSNIHEFSCYFNALPAMETNKQKRFYHSRSLKENVHDANVVEELRKVLLNLSQGGGGTKAISPECLFLVIWKVVPQFRGHRQHDAHEFLRYMLDRLHTELQQINGVVQITGWTKTTCDVEPSSLGIFKGRSSIVTTVFGGILQSEVRCLICGMESKKHDPFLDLSLDIPERFYKECNEDNQTVCNISDCLSSFTEVEELAETELYYCNSCKCKQKSTKRFWIRRLPNVLCLHIKRFRWSNFFRTKIDLRISFPINSLDMSQFVLNNGPETRRSNSSNNVYDLAAVIVHHGNGSSCGHYTSFAINNGTWLHFNDHTVKEVSPAAVAECKPYILFYIRRDSSKNS